LPSRSRPSPSRSRPLPSHPMPSRPLRRAVHCKQSIPTSSSRPLLHRQAVFCELSIASRPSLHRQAVIVHHELSIALLPSRPALYRRAVHRQAVHCPRMDCINLNCYYLHILGLSCSQIV
jgi:hypothetical protein